MAKRQLRDHRMRLTEVEANVIKEMRAKPFSNVNSNNQLDSVYYEYLQERDIDPKDVVSCKHWQAANGDPRFSIVTKNNDRMSESDRENLIQSIYEVIADHSPHKPKSIKYDESEHLLVINPADVHIGKYAEAKETGEEYNKEIAKNRVLEGVKGLIDKSKGFNIDRVLFCIGNDILHVDSVNNTTTRGTHQNMDGMWWESFELALEVYVECVNMLLEVAPVDCIHSMSNHDYQSGFHLAHALKAWFRDDKNVTVDATPSYRKYYKYYANMIGLEHGDGAKMADIPLLMAQEEPKMWGETTHRTMFLHHLHHKIKTKFQSAKDYIGVTVEHMRSPSGADSWHAKMGYKGSPVAIEGFLFHKTHGRIATLVHNF